MTRVTTSNYGADATTQFAWATAGTDFFRRTQDLYYLSQAVERHDHSSGRGLPVARLAAGVVDAAALAPLSVGTTMLQDLSVTTNKLAAGSVTRDKLSMPWVQATNDFAGGIRMRETANTYVGGWYMAANGLLVFGSGTIAGSIGTNLILGQAGQVSVGTAQGGALFNVMQAGGNAVGNGLRVYNTNTGFFVDLYNQANGYGAIAANGNVCALFEPGARGGLILGATASAGGKLTIQQAAGTAAEGIYQIYGGGIYQNFVDTNGDINIRSVGTSLILKHTSAALHPLTNGGADLGLTGTRWATIYAINLNLSTGSLTVGSIVASSAGAVSGVTSLGMGGALTGVTSLGMGGALTGATTITASSQVTVGSILTNGVIMPNGDGSSFNLGTTTNRFARLWLTDAIGIGISVTPSFQVHLSLDSAAKPNGGSWSNTSDRRLKLEESIHDYESGLDTILALRPRHFHWNGLGGIEKSKADDPYLVGFIADEVKKIAPEMYREYRGKIHPDDKRTSRIGAVNDSALPYILINAVKELHARLDALEKHAS